MPTITVRLFDYGTLKSELRSGDRVLILGCDGCARQSDGLGGEKGVNSLADKLVADGFQVVRREVLPTACSPDQLTDRLQDKMIRAAFEEADVIIPLTCRTGEGRAGQALPEIRMLKVTKTLGKGSFSPEDGARLTEPFEGVDVEIEGPEGISIGEAAAQLGLWPGSF